MRRAFFNGWVVVAVAAIAAGWIAIIAGFAVLGVRKSDPGSAPSTSPVPPLAASAAA